MMGRKRRLKYFTVKRLRKHVEASPSFNPQSPSHSGPFTMAQCLNYLRSKIDWKRLESVEVEEVVVPEKGWFKKLLAFLGPGLLVSIAYIDPGNIDTDLQAGAKHKYEMVWVMFLSTIIGFILQLMSARLGIVTRDNLAEACRKSYPYHIRLMLWFSTEIAVIGSDIPEVIGTAFALKLLFGIPVWAGVLITGLDTLLFLAIQYFGIRILEFVVAAMVAVIAIAFIVQMFISKPPAVEVLSGFIPRLDDKDSIFSAVALLGAVVMPHNLYLHSALVQSRKFGDTAEKKKEAIFFNAIESGMALCLSFFVNFAIIVLAGTKFYPRSDIGLENASELLSEVFKGKWAGIIFGIALLASGQSSTLTGTYAGQFVMEGFLQLKMAPWIRNLITRSVAIVPSLAVALVFQDGGSDDLIVISSAFLSLQLPFALIPLLKITSSKERMGKEHANSIIFTIVGWILAALVTAANTYLMVSKTLTMEIINVKSAVGIIMLIVVIICNLGYFAFLIYITILPVNVDLEKEEQLRLGSNGIENGEIISVTAADGDDQLETSSLLERSINADV